MKLFRKNIEPRCAYCARGARIDDGHVACVKRGVVVDRTNVPRSATIPCAACRPGLRS